jgi:YebC/PmpR family DNA-binding regulatory protein
MAGHSHWAQIKHKKAQADLKRGKLLNKLINSIVIAAREGGDPNLNPKLRSAIERAKEFNVPKENIEKAIRRGAGLEAGSFLEEVLYEAYGPGGVGLIIKTITDNKNRTAAEIRSVLSKGDAKLANPGSVIWNFIERGIIIVKKEDLKEEEIFNLPIVDFQEKDNNWILIVSLENMNEIKEKLEKLGITSIESKIELIPKSTVEISEKDKEKLGKLIDELLDLSDVQEVFTNLPE